MSKNQIEAYNYYKKLYPTALLLFRVANNYVALCEDAIKMASSLSLTPIYDDIPKYHFHRNAWKTFQDLLTMVMRFALSR